MPKQLGEYGVHKTIVIPISTLQRLEELSKQLNLCLTDTIRYALLYAVDNLDAELAAKTIKSSVVLDEVRR